MHPDGHHGRRRTFSVLVHLNAEGRVDDLHPPPDMPARFVEAAERAIRASLFAPALQDGRAVPSEIRLTVNFEVPPAPPEGERVDEVIEVVGETEREPQRGIGDIRLDPRTHQAVAQPQTSRMLELAPGLVVEHVESEMHAPRVFLRGFDARHGQDIAFSVDGLPLNEVGHPHGHGLVDLNPILPEAVREIRLQQGPFDPAQGDFAVAGSATFELGLPEPGLMLKGAYGAFNTGRAVVGWRAKDRPGTFVLGEGWRTSGFGESRRAERVGMLARADGSGKVDWHVLGGLFTGRYQSAGVVRADDVEAGRIDAFGTHDPNQGGTMAQAFSAAGVHGQEGDTHWWADLGLAWRSSSLRTNFTGFLTDDRRPGEAPHPQRGDGLDQTHRAVTVNASGRARQDFLGHKAVEGSMEVGVQGRFDDVDGLVTRLRTLDGRAYRTEHDYRLLQGHGALFAGGEIRLGQVFTLRGGGRLDGFVYQLDDRCAARDVWFAGAEQTTDNCKTVDRTGPVTRQQNRSAGRIGLSPRVTAAFHLPEGNELMAAFGQGLRSMEALALSDGEEAPFGRATSADVGWQHRAVGNIWTTMHRVSGYVTHVERDLIFDEVAGANLYGGETWRWGGSLESEVHVKGFTKRTTFAYTYAVFGDELPPRYTQFNTDRQAGMLVPYVPPVVLRSDLSYQYQAGPLQLRHGARASYLSPRPLPQSERAAPVATLDLSTTFAWRGLELDVIVTNVTNARYAEAEFNYSSWFPETSGPFPTRVPVRHISYGAPIGALASLTVYPGGF